MDLAEEYAEACDLQKKDLLYLMDEFSEEIAQMHGKCIDIGCGPGISTRLLLQKMPSDSSVIGGDISKSMIEFARKKHDDEKRLSFVELDIATEKLAPNLIDAFDNAISTYCIHWCSDQSQAFKNIYKMLRPGGRALVLYISSYPVYDTYPKLHDYPEYQPYMKDYSNFIPFSQNHGNPRATVKKIIEESGFEVLQCSRRERTFIFKNGESLQRSAISINPFFNRIPEALRKKYEDDILREFMNVKDANILFNTGNESTKQPQILTRYNVLIAYIKKPSQSCTRL